MQSKQEIETWYSAIDPWGYSDNKDDTRRKKKILSYLGKYKKALDIGCGEGWITKDLPADEIHGYEISDEAAKRLPSNVKRVLAPDDDYDLVIATGVLYKQYDHKKILEIIKRCAKGHLLLCNIKSWELPFDLGEHIYEEFKYREYTQILRFYDFTSQHR